MADRSMRFRFLATDDASKVLRGVANEADRTGKRLSGFAKVAAGAGAAAGGAFAGKFAVDSVQAFAEAQQSALKLQDAYNRFPRVADRSITSFEALNSSLARKTKYDDDATASAQALLAQFGLTGEQLQELTPLLQDYASRTGKELTDAAGDLGKAIYGQGRALRDVGLTFTNTGSKTKNFEQLMTGLRRQAGGFAEQEGRTVTGRLEILRNRMGELQEEAGGRLLPVLERLAVRAERFADEFETGSGTGGQLRDTLAAVGAAAKQAGELLEEHVVPTVGFLSRNSEAVQALAVSMAAFATASKFAALWNERLAKVGVAGATPDGKGKGGKFPVIGTPQILGGLALGYGAYKVGQVAVDATVGDRSDYVLRPALDGALPPLTNDRAPAGPAPILRIDPETRMGGDRNGIRAAAQAAQRAAADASKAADTWTDAIGKQAKKDADAIKRAGEARARAFEDAKERLRSAIEDRQSTAKGIRDSLIGSTTVLRDGISWTGRDLLASFERRVRRVKEFQGYIQAMVRKGFSATIVRQVAEAGVEGGFATARGLATTTSAADVRRFNTLGGELDAAATGTGNAVQRSMFGNQPITVNVILDGKVIAREMSTATAALLQRNAANGSLLARSA